MKKHKSGLVRKCEAMLRQIEQFTYWGGHMTLRPYQEEAIRAVVESVKKSLGLRFVWIFPRQSGKDEALALMVAYLLTAASEAGAEMVFINPTFKPQTETSMRRLETRLETNALTRGRWRRRSGYIYTIGKAFCSYLSADPAANIVGATANRILILNEAQDISIAKYDKDLDPMAASANATRLFSGTRWTSNTLLEREYRQAMEDEKRDGTRRVFFFTAEDVRKSSPAYGKHLEEVIARLGRQNPLVRTQYFCETIEARAGMFPAGRQALMYGSHPARLEPEAGKMYAFLIDVAGQDEENKGIGDEGLGEKGIEEREPAHYAGRDPAGNAGRDSTFLKVVEVDNASVAISGKPTYKVVLRQAWTGEKHVQVFGALRGLAATWRPHYMVIDATGVGEGLWSMLEAAFGAEVVKPVKFSAGVKSELGYGFLGIVESGRYQEYHPFDSNFRKQLEACHSEIVPGPAKLMRWGVPDGTRDAASRQVIHDDDLITGAMCTILDGLDWYVPGPTMIIRPRDPLPEMDRNF